MDDSDYDLSEDDDDLVDENDNERPSSSTKACPEKMCKEDYSEDDDLWGPESDDDEGVTIREKTFREVDLNEPKFKVGMQFESVELLRKAIQVYSCKNRKDIKVPINDRKRLKAHCKEECPWYLWASVDSRSKCFRIKKYNDEHTCAGTFKVKKFTSKFLADIYVESFRADPDMNMKNFARIIQKEWNMTPGRSKLQRARRLALKVIYGDEEAQYNKLWDYATEIRRSNPGSIFFLSLDEQGRFKRCYMYLQASKLGFLQGCRPVIFVDGCHIKTRHRGQLLTAVGMDPNNCIFPISIAAVEVEDTANWTWFLDTLKSDLGIINTNPWTVMSDKQKGLINAVQHVFPEAEHRFCVRHMWQNFNQRFRGDVLKNQLWKIARSNTATRYEANMEAMKVLNVEAHAWLAELDPRTWVRAFQFELPKCDILLNNNCEVFNKYILEARELPILAMFAKIKGQLMTRHYNKQKEQEKWTGHICPKIMKLVEKNTDYSNNCYVEGACDSLFSVGDRFSSTATDYVIDLRTKKCTCNRWQQSGVPCPHVIACVRQENIDPLSLVDKCYSIDMHNKTYANIVHPCKDITEWEIMNGPTILPPVYQKHFGRPTKKRRKAPGEIDCRGGGKRMSRHGVIMHCSYRGLPDHNRKGCYWFKNGLVPPNSVPLNDPTPSAAPNPEPVSTQESTIYGPTVLPSYQDTFVERLSQEVPTVRNVAAVPIPQSSFITEAQSQVDAQPTTSTVRQGEMAQKLLALQREKTKAIEDKKLAILEAKLEAQLKKAEDAAKKRIEKEQEKASKAQAKAAEIAAKREAKKAEAELKQKVRAETKRIIAEVNKEVANKKKELALEKKIADKKLEIERRYAQQAAQKAALQQEAAQRGWSATGSSAKTPTNTTVNEEEDFMPQTRKKVSMFDEFRCPRKTR